ncbi:MAG: hypothetical protein R3C26_00150 [Calditrichia bacterium]
MGETGGDGFEVKIIDSTLWVRSQANMVGYLNAPNAIDADGWMCTGDKCRCAANSCASSGENRT